MDFLFKLNFYIKSSASIYNESKNIKILSEGNNQIQNYTNYLFENFIQELYNEKNIKIIQNNLFELQNINQKELVDLLNELKNNLLNLEIKNKIINNISNKFESDTLNVNNKLLLLIKSNIRYELDVNSNQSSAIIKKRIIHKFSKQSNVNNESPLLIKDNSSNISSENSIENDFLNFNFNQNISQNNNIINNLLDKLVIDLNNKEKYQTILSYLEDELLLKYQKQFEELNSYIQNLKNFYNNINLYQYKNNLLNNIGEKLKQKSINNKEKYQIYISLNISMQIMFAIS